MLSKWSNPLFYAVVFVGTACGIYNLQDSYQRDYCRELADAVYVYRDFRKKEIRSQFATVGPPEASEYEDDEFGDVKKIEYPLQRVNSSVVFEKTFSLHPPWFFFRKEVQQYLQEGVRDILTKETESAAPQLPEWLPTPDQKQKLHIQIEDHVAYPFMEVHSLNQNIQCNMSDRYGYHEDTMVTWDKHTITFKTTVVPTHKNEKLVLVTGDVDSFK